MINPLRGMKDLTFEESARFVHIVTTAITIAKRYGYHYIETPILEETALFRRSVGESSDIVGKASHNINDNNMLIVSGYFSRDKFKLNSDSLYQYFNSNASLQWRHTFSNQLHAVSSVSFANVRFVWRSKS